MSSLAANGTISRSCIFHLDMSGMVQLSIEIARLYCNKDEFICLVQYLYY